MLAKVSPATMPIKSLRTFLDRSPNGADFSMIVRAKLRTPELDRNSTSLPVDWMESRAMQPIPSTVSLRLMVDGVVALA